MRKELPKQYDPTQVESQIYQMWLDNDCFKAEPDPDKKPYSIVMPPPNVTGQLHMGHALDSTLQDILAGRKTEVDIFAGAVIRLGKEYGVPTPYNEFLYHAIRVLEAKNAGTVEGV